MQRTEGPSAEEVSFSYNSRDVQRNTAQIGTGTVKDYRASSFQLNIIQEEERNQTGGTIAAGANNVNITNANSPSPEKQFLRMGKAGSSILN